MNINKKDLMTPLFALYNFEALNDINLKSTDSEYMKNVYSLEERKQMHKSLQWAEQNPDFQFENIMEEAPVVGYLKFNNDEVYQYLMLFKMFMENEEYELLTDDRPINEPWEE